MKTQNFTPMKIDKENTNYLYGTMVTEGIFVLIPIDQKKDPMGSGEPNYFIVSEKENIHIGDKFLTPDGKVYERKDFEQMDCDKKIIVLPENFSPELIQDIVNGKLKNGDKVSVKCSMVDREEWMGDNENGQPFGMEDYFIRLNSKNHIELYSKEEGKKRELKNLFRMYFEGVSEFVEPIEPMSVSRLEITDIQFEFKPEVIEMTITLERPGLLIGKGGRTIDGVTEYLSKKDTPVKIKIVESKLWR